MAKIIVAASINMDVVARVAALPRAGETVAGSELRYIPGGKGANQAVAAARLGGDTHIIGKVGDDASGASLLDFLRDEPLDISRVAIAPGTPSGTALIVVDEESENTIVIIAGANAHNRPEDFSELNIEAGDIITTQFEIPLDTVAALFTKAKSAGAVTTLNAAPARDCPPDILEATDYLIMNETELAFFAQSESIPRDEQEIATAARQLRSRANQAIVVTLGPRGALCIQENALTRVEGYAVDAVDTTAAGDCFVGAFAVALAEGRALEDALRFSNAAAALSVQTFGASSSLPERVSVDAFLQSHA